ncbi:cytochrome-c peroxidase [Campylobacter sp. RM9334]|uniref:cytochrome-c peroxidase n=1 Tax=unclassified Campylobacter TaxID=2593542 RepID=UPI001DE9140E|nr:cytochrome-c peroxidase [Campylobacter sp. RM12654]MBZ8007396.1 cytochrome-c peroxidase [Campylobacter sp. RM9334]
MKKIMLSLSLLAGLNAASLIDEAKEAGLVAIPSDKAKLEELIKQYAPDYVEYPTTKERVEIGKKLYFDPRISKSGIISCNTCHNLGLGGTDGVPASTGHKWSPNPHHLNSPTVYNSVFNSSQFWDGRSGHLQDQAKGPIQSSVEMAAIPSEVVSKITSIPEYVNDFKKAYGDKKIDFDLIATSIGIFERTLITPSRFDEFLNGNEKALSKEEKQGLKLFIDKGCTACHTGINLGGTLQAFEVANKYKYANIGDFKGDSDGLIKAPTLRNIELTAPYYHNGAIWELDEAVKLMGKIQLGIEINDEESQLIITFLKSLTGKMPDITYPSLPASTSKTIKPDLEY